MKELFLSSSFKDVATVFADFKRDLKGKTVTFIPTASIVEKVVFYVASGKKVLEKLGLKVDILEISTSEPKEIKAKLKNNEFIYVTGGNTFFLLQELKRTGADKIIIEEVNAGKVYIGESAGAMVVSPNVEYAIAMDSIKKAPHLENFDALNLVSFYTVPHYTNFPFQKAAQKIVDTYSSILPLFPISNNEALLIRDNQVILKSL
ncbi:peptidase E [Rodentibacter sp. Ppn85]|uniref:peptidase E n=1 Tax=Rodentibacter sp. Ppn85 TaxID=1908525 RepID=UPI0009860EC9|nr:Type 1 glutamine amidotransferase-like domain-containing protein [Rodentibacter sp. Ppn85]OOF65898.1 peptidase [Rodentibacter sp. Ppn85]